MAVAQRTQLIEDILSRLWRDLVSPDESKPANFTLVATGGFGRGWMFPYSDVDILFLYGDRETEQAFKDPVRRFSQELWDLRLKLSPVSRTLAECDRYDANNTEFTISLLDCRYLAGDRDLYRRLHDKVIPKVVMRESKALLQGLAEVTRERHGKHGSDSVPSRTESQRSARWITRLQRGELARPDLCDGQVAGLARR